MVGQYLPQTNEKYYSIFSPSATVFFRGTKHSRCLASETQAKEQEDLGEGGTNVGMVCLVPTLYLDSGQWKTT